MKLPTGHVYKFGILHYCILFLHGLFYLLCMRSSIKFPNFKFSIKYPKIPNCKTFFKYSLVIKPTVWYISPDSVSKEVKYFIFDFSIHRGIFLGILLLFFVFFYTQIQKHL